MVLTAKCSAGGIAPCLVPDDSIGSTATRFGGHPEDVNIVYVVAAAAAAVGGNDFTIKRG